MNALEFFGWTLSIGTALFLVLIIRTLCLEQEQKRIPRVLFPGMLLLAVLTTLLLTEFPGRDELLYGAEAAALALCLLFFLPVGKVEPLVLPPDMDKMDERDIMFARANYRAGDPSYQDYYMRHPENQAVDDHIRSLPGICSPGSAAYDPLQSRIAGAAFHYLSHQRTLAEGIPADEKQPADPAALTKTLKELAFYYGAAIVGVTEIKPYHYYSHRGRHPENYGEEVTTKDHKFAIAFAVEMDYFMLKGAPQMQVVLESSRQYVEGAKIGMILSYFIRELGYGARNHMDGNYLVCAPLVAHDAGIGELSRLGILITREYGPRVRLGVVTTDLPLVPDTPKAFGVQDSCRICKKCARNCPSLAIPHEDKTLHCGTLKWKIDQEKCYEFWCKVGTDCAICLNSCPYSKPNTLLHRLFRYCLRRSAIVRRVMVPLDDYLYGRRPFSSRKPTWTK